MSFVAWTRQLVVFENFYFFFFFQHFLQQYRRHRIHSFTNTKHTTTLVAAAAAAKKRRGGEGLLRRLEVASSASAIRTFQTLPSSIIARKNLPFGSFCHFWDLFSSVAIWWNNGKSFLLRHVGVKQNVSRLWSEHDVTSNERKQKRRLKEEAQLDSVATKEQFHHSACSQYWNLTIWENLKKKNLSFAFFFQGYSAEKLHHLNLDHLVLSSLLLLKFFIPVQWNKTSTDLQMIFFFLKIQKASFIPAIFSPQHHSQTLPTKNRTLILYTSVCVCWW